MGEFRLVDDGRHVDVAAASARVIAFLGLSDERVEQRSRIAQVLWPDRSAGRAMANLRSALWRMPATARPCVDLAGDRLVVPPDVDIDVDVFTGGCDDAVPELESLTAPLLPGWYDDWVVVERERLELRRIDLLEQLAVTRSDSGRYAEAIDVALAASELEPYRESLHRIVIEAHLAERNVSEAITHYERLEKLLVEEVGLRPSTATTHLVSAVTHS